mmetsp:Transcript_71014/g.157890  ORF Transcript_71014/g.157890 Transcript_71014/m.157890 type:complete len:323 (-) Transcript_71014:258-1226(-)
MVANGGSSATAARRSTVGSRAWQSALHLLCCSGQRWDITRRSLGDDSTHAIPCLVYGCTASAAAVLLRTLISEKGLDNRDGELSADRLLDVELGGFPPAARLHLLARDEDAAEQLIIVLLLPVEREQAAARTDPREGDTRIAQVILEHPVIAAGGGVHHRPYREPVLELEREARFFECCVRLGHKRVDTRMHCVVLLGRLRARVPFEKGVHRAHDCRVASERTDHVGDACRLLRVGARHRLLFAAQHANRQPAAEGLAVHHHVGLHIICLLRTLGGHAKAGVHLVEDEEHARIGARLAQLRQPLLVAVLCADFAVVGLQYEV